MTATLGQSKMPRARAFELFGILAVVFFSGDALALSISPSPSSTGNYTVSWGPTDCQETGQQYPYPPYICTYLYDDAGQVAATSPVNIFGKPAGTYNYYVVVDYLWYQETVDSGSVIVGTPPPRDPIATQLTYQYQTRQGDMNGDGLTDLFVKRTSGGLPGNGVLDQVILVQHSSGGPYPYIWTSTFVPDAYYSSLASSWPISSATTVVDDLNVDGYVDVAVKGVAAATGGQIAYNQIIFSSGVPLQPQPLGLSVVNPTLKHFIANALDYVVNHNYFYENAAIDYSYGYYYYYYCAFSPYYYGAIESFYYGSWGCGIYYDYFYGAFYNFSQFSEQAVAIWTNEAANQAGMVSNSQSTQNAQQAAENVLTVPIGGWPMEEELGTEEGPHLDPDARRGLETFWSILGIARAYATEIATVQAPQQVPRAANTVWITAHKVFGFLPHHTALEFTYPGGQPTQTLSAISWPAPIIGPWLASRLNRAGLEGKLKELKNLTFGCVTNLGNPIPALNWDQLKDADSRYDDFAVPYLAIPFGPFYNSNGFINGLIRATGGDALLATSTPSCIQQPFDWTRYVGGAKLVPLIEFQ